MGLRVYAIGSRSKRRRFAHLDTDQKLLSLGFMGSRVEGPELRVEGLGYSSKLKKATAEKCAVVLRRARIESP